MTVNPVPTIPTLQDWPADAVRGVWRAPDGWAHRRYDRPGDGRGRLLLQAGRADMIEKYLETLAHFHDRGWATTAFDWRGQGGSGRLAEGDVGHLDDFATLVADLAAFWRDWKADGEGPHVLVCHSMGAFVALRAVVERAIDPDAVVLAAPMLGLRNPLGAWIGGGLARRLAARGDVRRAAWAHGVTPRAIRNRQRRLTHDPARFADEQAWFDREPTLRLGPPSWGWIVQAFAATAALRDDARIATVTTPVQMLVADTDQLVDARAALRVASRLPDVDLVRFGRESAHEILREADPVRQRALAAIDGFLDARAPRR
ncbi:alpha/beta fold hydrolase [Sphingomonas sp. Leaf343]|uniref:alpha/beta fold hydrolase n=1 Tax=Sphingomonas sp. Leaf343 TaxID=1736345 RepID=UPI0009E70F7C|nr:alpha/beta hydrolase [Sphingomonas sp. Leaf343]